MPISIQENLESGKPPAPSVAARRSRFYRPCGEPMSSGVSKAEGAVFPFGRSGASQKPLTTVARAVGCRTAGGSRVRVPFGNANRGFRFASIAERGCS